MKNQPEFTYQLNFEQNKKTFLLIFVIDQNLEMSSNYKFIKLLFHFF